MKKITLLILSLIVATTVIYVGCTKDKTPPTVSFTANTTSIFAGQTVNFTDNSTGGPTSWSWTFPGGTPSTSNLQNPVITYNSTNQTSVTANGTFDVTLSCSNADGNTASTKTAYITVKPNNIVFWSNYQGPEIEVYCSTSNTNVYSSSNYYGNITSIYTAAPSCNASGCVNVVANFAGTLYVYAREIQGGIHTFSGSITITPGCTQVALNLSKMQLNGTPTEPTGNETVPSGLKSK